MSLAILFHFLCAQHVSDINISIIGSLRLFCLITTLVVLFLVRCVLKFRCGWVGVVSVLQAEACSRLYHLGLCTYTTLFLKVIGLQGRIPNTSAGNWFQCWMVLFTKGYFPISVLLPPTPN